MTRWAERAADASRALVDTYWDPRRGLFRVTSARRPFGLVGPWHYWWQAHALDALVAAGDGERAGQLLAGVLRRNRGRITNNYYDDMAWMGLALHGLGSAGDLVAELQARHELGELVAELMACLRAGVHPEHGAVVWRRGDSYLNVPANAPTAILAARTGDIDLARRLTTWLHRTLVSPDGVVLDGLHPGGRPDASEWTYNYGTVVGADVALGELDRARRVASMAASRLVRARGASEASPAVASEGIVGADGVLRDEGPGDRSLFKGIFARHVGQLGLATGDDAVNELLLRNAEAAWASRSPDGLVGPDWTRRPEPPVELSAHLSGVLLFHTVASIA